MNAITVRPFHVSFPLYIMRLVGVLALVLAVNAVSSQKVLAHSGPHVTIRTGDTLSQIAQDNGVSMQILLELNNLASPDHIRLGQELALPAVSTSDAISASEEASSRGWIEYEVREGDTLALLARHFHIGLAILSEFNRISPSQQLYAGQHLRLPITSNSLRVIAPPSRPAGKSHVVQSGEHLGTISKLYGATAQEIARANNLLNASMIVPGQKLLIPGTAETATNNKNAKSAGSSRFIIEETPTLVGDETFLPVKKKTELITATPDYATFPTTTEKWIDVNLTTQTATAYNGAQPVRSFIISSGTERTPTVQGTFRIWATTPIQDMFSGSPETGYDYYIEDVQWVQYFYEDYAFHGADWHNNFGQPMSHGCVHLPKSDAQWLFEWASPQVSKAGWTFLSGANQGTLVKVHE